MPVSQPTPPLPALAVVKAAAVSAVAVAAVAAVARVAVKAAAESVAKTYAKYFFRDRTFSKGPVLCCNLLGKAEKYF